MASKDMDFHTETGRLSLDWIATLGDRQGASFERIANTADLKRWLTTVAVQDVASEPSEHDLVAVKRLRAALVRLMDRLYSDEAPSAQDIQVVNECAALPPPAMQLGRTGRTVDKNSGVSVSAVISAIARDAIDLFTSDDFAKVKLCAAEDCSVYFVDYSRPGKRRWCSMSRCGNRAKKKAFVERNLRNRQRVD
ncbi:MAG: CGNR zinc finger domain-containing protein [Pseudomonadota bacterium]